MILAFIELLALVVFASILQRNYKIPSPITLMSAVLISMGLNYPLFNIASNDFDNLVLLTLPLLIAADAAKLSWNDVKTHGLSLFWVAGISVLLSVGIGVLINDFVLVDYPLSIAAVIILFCMVSATDPITVSAIFSNFNVPHKLKLITEGESLFNDATALIVFSIALVALSTPDTITAGFIATKTFSIIIGALIIGLISGFITTVALKLSDEPLVEGSIILLFAYLAYYIAEHFHFSGILAVIVSIIMANTTIQKIIHKEQLDIDTANKTKNIPLLKYAMTTLDNQKTINKSIEFVSMFASAALFVSIASVANFTELLHYKYEIIAVFIASTIIRAIMMLKFAFISNKVDKMQQIAPHWWAVLTFAGSKGALSILMVHMIPSTFIYKSLFEHIIIGNILLSTFIYAAILAVIIVKNKLKFELECKAEDSIH